MNVFFLVGVVGLIGFFGTGCLFWELVGGRDELFSFLKFLLFLNFNNLLLMTFGNGEIWF